MKKIVLITIFLFSGIFTTNAQEATIHLTVSISGIESNEGKILIALYNKKNQFLKTEFKSAIISIVSKKAIYVFKDIQKGEYAISIFHDKNMNRKLDTNLFGIPKEAYGFSNNAKGFMGPPKYEKTKFLLTKSKTILIKI